MEREFLAGSKDHFFCYKAVCSGAAFTLKFLRSFVREHLLVRGGK